MSENVQTRYDDQRKTLVSKSRIGGIIVGIILFIIGGMIGSFLSIYWIASNPSILPESPIKTVQLDASQQNNGSSYPTDSTDGMVLSQDPIVNVAASVSQSVVKIDVMTQSRYGWQKTGSGSGFIVSEDGYIVTNNHVVDGSQKILVERKNGEKYEAQLIGTDSISDIALIQIEASGLPFLEFEKSEQVRVGETVIAIGNPYGYEYTVTKGVVSAIQRELSLPETSTPPPSSNPFEGTPFDGFEDYFDFNIPQQSNTPTANIPMVGVVQTDAAINPGNSGGPLVDMEGKVIGVNFLIDAQGQGLGFAIDSNTVTKVIEDLRKYGTVSWASLGVVITENTDEIAASLKLSVNTGVVVVEVPAGNARKAGILKQDVILGMDDRMFHSPQELITYVRSKDPGDEVELFINRDGKEMKIKTILEELKK
ncbi:MAG: trypsin-like peptidase domain-containing protein [Caldisericia bacterium]|nr:trypsin-like peptidase domain-containing protein [Caldisericia bacterium]MDD4614314.1 trypsin-like peptidase domain-containing protein [Caldisericia bacterium]